MTEESENDDIEKIANETLFALEQEENPTEKFRELVDHYKEFSEYVVSGNFSSVATKEMCDSLLRLILHLQNEIMELKKSRE